MSVRYGTCALFAIALGATPPCTAQFDPAREFVEPPAVAARFPDPDVTIATPAFEPGHDDFTSHDEMMAFIAALATRDGAPRVVMAGQSQEGRAIPLLVFARASGTGGADLTGNGRPTVLVIGQQHGNEPAGGEAALALAADLAGPAGARVLERVNVLIVPRANPDGAHRFVRGLANGADLNRDHLLEATPEGRALGRVFVDYQPDVVLDCHEFTVRRRWVEKFDALQRYDALIQYATLANLPPELTDAAERLFRLRVLSAFDSAGLTHSWYYTTSYDMSDRRVSMGGVVPDTGRNVAALRNAVSFLLESRGVGIGRAHYKRRVQTHLVAMRAMIDGAAENAGTLLELRRRLRDEVAASAGRGSVVVSGVAARTRHTLDMLDPETGSDKQVDVDWQNSLEIDPRLVRPRPYGYVLPASEEVAASRLRRLGVDVLRVVDAATIDVERYRVVEAVHAKKDDVRRNDDEGVADVLRITTETERARVAVKRGDFYVPLDQPLANLVVAALEPETQSSYAANRLLNVPAAVGAQRPPLPLYRVVAKIALPAVVWNGE